jgi:hypothetical protein
VPIFLGGVFSTILVSSMIAERVSNFTSAAALSNKFTED